MTSLRVRPGKAYPTMPGDIVVNCPVCSKQVPLTPRRHTVWEVLFHNGPKGGPCNGTGRMANLTNLSTGSN